jgi:hypothetical protein
LVEEATLQAGVWKVGCQERKAVRESVGVKWSNKRKENADERFDRRFDLLLVFKERAGHVKVPIKHQEVGDTTTKLGVWLGRQRSLCRRQGLLDLELQKWLEVAGVTWEIRTQT